MLPVHSEGADDFLDLLRDRKSRRMKVWVEKVRGNAGLGGKPRPDGLIWRLAQGKATAWWNISLEMRVLIQKQAILVIENEN
jgi:hypothetical protein